MGMENTTQLRQSAFSSGTAEAMGMENQNTSAALPQMAGREPLSQLHGPGQPGCPYASAAFTGANSWEVQGMNRKGHVDYGPLTPDYNPTLLPLPPAPPLDTVRPGACFFKLRCVSLA